MNTEKIQNGTIHLNRVLPRTVPVLTPSGQISVMYSGLHQVLVNSYSFSSDAISRFQKDRVICLSIALQLLCSLRISEVLAIRLKDVGGNGNVYINTKKKGQSIVIKDSLICSIFREYKKANYEIFASVSRQYIYRQYKIMGIVSVSSGKFQLAVTHAFRHHNAKEVRKQTDDPKMLKNVLHHNSILSQEYYGRK